MKFFRRDLLSRLRHKFFLAPAGYGKPVPKEALDHEYSSGAWAHFHQLPEQPRQVLVAGMTACLHATPAVLDIGCGSGRLAQLFQPFNARRYVGIDLSSEGIARAQMLGLKDCEFIEASFETWTPSETFDVILFSECIGYARDPGALVKRFLPYLAADGHMIISHFRFGNWEAHWDRVLRHVRPVESVSITNSLGQTWDVKVLQPAGPP